VGEQPRLSSKKARGGKEVQREINPTEWAEVLLTSKTCRTVKKALKKGKAAGEKGRRENI